MTVRTIIATIELMRTTRATHVRMTSTGPFDMNLGPMQQMYVLQKLYVTPESLAWSRRVASVDKCSE